MIMPHADALYSSYRELTIISPDQSSGRLSPETLALALLGWILGDESRADRLLSLTGLTPDILRERLDDPGVLIAILEFLLAHEPDLMKAADDLQIKPDDIVSAHESLTRR